MKLIRIIGILCLVIVSYQCGSSFYRLQKESVLTPKNVYFQTWVAGIKDGGSGYYIYFPNLNPDDKVTMDSVYFRGLKGKLIKKKAMYRAYLKNTSPYDRDMSIEAANKKEEKPFFPFDLDRMECVISYIQSGETKYLKIEDLKEKEGVYYPQGAPNN